MSAVALVPIVVAAVVIGVAGLVRSDARVRDREGRPVIATVGALVVDTPDMWFALCAVLSIIFIPLYLVARGPS